MPWGDSGIYGGCSRRLKHRIFAQNCRERGQLFVKMMIIWSHQSISMTSYDHPYIIYIYRKMMIIRSHKIGCLVTSYDHPYLYMYRKMMIIRSHNIGSLVTSYHHPYVNMYRKMMIFGDLLWSSFSDFEVKWWSWELLDLRITWSEDHRITESKDHRMWGSQYHEIQPFWELETLMTSHDPHFH